MINLSTTNVPRTPRTLAKLMAILVQNFLRSLDDAAWKSGIVTEDFRHAMSAPLDDFDPSEFGGHGVLTLLPIRLACRHSLPRRYGRRNAA